MYLVSNRMVPEFLKLDKGKLLLAAEAAIEGVQASVDALKLVSGGWCLKIEIVFGNI